MLKYILKRIGLSVFILLGVSFIIYFLIRSMPTSYIDSKIAAINQGGTTVPTETIESMKEAYGLADGEDLIGKLKGYGRWLTGLIKIDPETNKLTLDFGTSFKYAIPVTEKIKESMGVSFAIALIATIFEFMIAIPLGITAATHQYSLRDYIVTILVMIGISLPTFFFGQMLKGLAMSVGLPPSGLIDATKDYVGFDLLIDYIKHLIIPILTVVILSIGGRMSFLRNTAYFVAGLKDGALTDDYSLSLDWRLLSSETVGGPSERLGGIAVTVYNTDLYGYHEYKGFCGSRRARRASEPSKNRRYEAASQSAASRRSRPGLLSPGC